MLEELSFFLVLLVGIMGNQITLQVWPGNAVLRNKVVVALAFPTSGNDEFSSTV